MAKRYLLIHQCSVDAFRDKDRDLEEVIITNYFFLAPPPRREVSEVELDTSELDVSLSLTGSEQAGVDRQIPTLYKIFKTRDQLRDSPFKPVIGKVELADDISTSSLC